MVNRIFTFIELLKLTTTEFADRIGVSRASISSIKTGRTQPTLPLVEKIKQHYPDIDVEWLIFGKGDVPIVNEVQQEEITISHDESKQEIEDGIVDDKLNDNAANEYQAVYIAETPQKREEKQQDLNISNQATVEKKRNIKKVILFYEDGSFEEFNK